VDTDNNLSREEDEAHAAWINQPPAHRSAADVLITPDDIMEMEPCDRYSRDRVKELFGDETGATFEEVASDQRISPLDGLWVLLNFPPWLTDGQRGELACRFAERVLPFYEERRTADLRGFIEVRRRFIAGGASLDELDKVYEDIEALYGEHYEAVADRGGFTGEYQPTPVFNTHERWEARSICRVLSTVKKAVQGLTWDAGMEAWCAVEQMIHAGVRHPGKGVEHHWQIQQTLEMIRSGEKT